MIQVGNVDKRLQKLPDQVSETPKEGPYGGTAVLINISNVNAQGCNQTKLFTLLGIITSKILVELE